MESRKRASHVKGLVNTNREKVIDDLKKNSLYDTKEACEILDISTQSLRRAISKGKIKTVRLGRYLRIPSEEIQRLTKGESALLNVQEASNLLGLSEHTIRAYIKSSKINAFRLASTGPFKIPKSEIDRISREGITT